MKLQQANDDVLRASGLCNQNSTNAELSPVGVMTLLSNTALNASINRLDISDSTVRITWEK